VFSRKISRLDELHGLLPAQAIEVLRDLLGQANGRLEHDGPVVLGAPSGGKFGDNALLERSDFKFYGRPLGVTKWAVAAASSRVETDTKTGKDATWVEVRERDDQYGQYAAGYAAKGACESWFCSLDTGPKFDLLLAPFGTSNVSAQPGDIIPFSYDLSGLPVALGGGLQGGREKIRRARCTGDWQWMAGREWSMGQVQAVELSDIMGTTVGATAYTFYLPCAPGGDPNLHTGDEFSWMEDEAGYRVAIGDYLDSKIGTIDMLELGFQIRRGWRLYSDLTGFFPVGCGDGEYGAGATGGRSPIQPAAHDSDDKSTWLLQDHPKGQTDTATASVSIGTTTLYAETDYAQLECANTSPKTDARQVIVNIPPHAPPPYVPMVLTTYVDAVGGLFSNTVEEGFGHTELANGPDPHLHDVSVGIGGADFRHFVTVEPHYHVVDPHKHEVTDKGHGHDINPRDHGHYVNQSPHQHGTSALEHRGRLLHKREDFRPPWMAMPYILRVGPEED
jgi:hypothetical protein